MAKLFDAAEDSCWVVLYGQVYDVTDFLTEHPGGPNVILKLAGRDATQDYDPVHPPGTLEENLRPEARLGSIHPEMTSERASESTLQGTSESTSQGTSQDTSQSTSQDTSQSAVTTDPRPPLASLFNLDEIEAEATKRMSRKAWAYYFSASDDLVSKAYNNTVYRDILLRPRMFVDCTHCDTSTTLLGHKVGVPFFVAPAAMARLASPDGERGIARAAARFDALQIISNNASMTPEQIVQDAPASQMFGWQLYVQNQRAKSEAMLRRIASGRLADRISFVCLTLDAPVPGKRELDEKSNFVFDKAAPVSVLHGQAAGSQGKTAAAAAGGGVGQQLFFGTACDLTWKTTLPWLAKHTDLPIVLKGIQTHEDALLAAQHAPQVRAIILSNHGGRAMDTAPPAVHTLLEIRKYCPQVFRAVEVWVDGGIKRGTDVIKALCLGAKGVGLGRAPLFGLGAGGQAGVERMFEILQAETATCMRLLGVKTIAELGPHLINTRRVERDIYNGDAGLYPEGGLWRGSKL
ncbi:hypothetical protein E4U21_003527 [Claviceps maximensis]|nr:hypothetical protein E4U21_003527 [Claviceps maximensis]